LRPLALARAPVELAEAEVAVGDERTHTSLFGKSLRIVVVVFGRFQIRWVLKYCDFRDEAQRMGLFTAKLPLPCVIQSGGGNAPCVRVGVQPRRGYGHPNPSDALPLGNARPPAHS